MRCGVDGLPDPAPAPSPKDGSFYPIGVELGDDGLQCYYSPYA